MRSDQVDLRTLHSNSNGYRVPRRGDRADEGGSLENCWGETSRGFESPPPRAPFGRSPLAGNSLLGSNPSSPAIYLPVPQGDSGWTSRESSPGPVLPALVAARRARGAEPQETRAHSSHEPAGYQDHEWLSERTLGRRTFGGALARRRRGRRSGARHRSCGRPGRVRG